MSKRANPFAEFAAPSSQMAKRLKTIERRVNAAKPEMKHATFDLTSTVTAGTAVVGGLTGISQGDTINTRAGDRIKVWRVEIRGTASSLLDTYVLQAHGATAPVAADFNSTFGAFVLDSSLNTRFTEWRHYRNLNEGANDAGYKVVIRFKTGIVVKYNGTTSTPVQNGLYFVALNRGGSDRPTALTARIWYTDA